MRIKLLGFARGTTAGCKNTDNAPAIASQTSLPIRRYSG